MDLNCSGLGITNQPIPIGILTRNRPALLDLTLRSLCASKLPRNVQVIVYDDGSDTKCALDYLYTQKAVSGTQSFMPREPINTLPNIVPMNCEVYGIHGRVQVVRAESPLGVYHASVKVIHNLLEISESPYVCMIQDDVIFVQDWYMRMCKIATLQRPGILAGITFGSAVCPQCRVATLGAIEKSFVQAQCLFLSREMLLNILPHISAVERTLMRGFDVVICKAAVQKGYSILVMCPNICQHVGILSLVRPERIYDRKGGRFSRCVWGSIAVAAEVFSL